jgi:hypothetical protein
LKNYQNRHDADYFGCAKYELTQFVRTWINN